MSLVKTLLERYKKHIGFESKEKVKQDFKRDTSKLILWGLFIGGLWVLWTGFATIYVMAVNWFAYGMPPAQTLNGASFYDLLPAIVVVIGAIIFWGRRSG